MIRFLDTDVLAVQRCQIDRAYIRQHFLRKGHMDDILVVYDGEMYYGCITYDSFLRTIGSEDEDSYIFQGKYILTPNNDKLWPDLKEMSDEVGVGNALIPLFNVQGELLYFAYVQKEKERVGLRVPIENVLQRMEEMECSVLRDFLSEVYPQIKGVRIYDLNEWGYRFFKIMEACGYYIEVLGEKWKALFPNMTESEDGKGVSKKL